MIHTPGTLRAIVFSHSSRVSSSSSTMLSQSVAAISSPPSPSPSLFTSKSFRSQILLGVSNLGVVRTNGNRNISISCSSSFQDQNSEGLKEKTGLEWKDIISLGSANFFNQWEKKGKKLTHKELLNCISVTRRHQRYGLALEVYEWMKNQGDRFKMSSTDTTIQLDLIFRVHGISSAEEYFLKLPESSKDNLSYGVLLNAYVQSGMREKAESLFENMRGRGYTTCSLPFSSMMTLYTKLKEYEKVMALINEMLEKNVQLDINSYDIWITVCGELGLTEKMEMVVEQVKLDSHIDPNWRKYSTMASGFIKLCQTEKAQDCLKEVENRIMDGDQMPYKSLLTLYSTIGQKEDVYRIWCTYKSSFPSSLSLVYKDMIASLVSLKDVKFTEKILEESNDPELRYVLINLLICQYVTKGLLGDAKGFADQNEGQIYSWTWETLANCCIEQKQCSNALYCVEKAATTAVGAKSWRPNPKTVTALSAACGMNVKSEDELLKVLRK